MIPSVRIIQGDCLVELGKLPAESVHCVVTSPPYWGLRDYGVAGQIGLEKTPEDYVAVMVGVFREVRRILRPDATCWINLGDSYAGAGYTNNDNVGLKDRAIGKPKHTTTIGLKPKDLCGVPWRVAFALQADGWYLRSDIIWHKPNPMPESVTDRPTKAHEYIFLLSKNEWYYYDAEAVKENAIHAGKTVKTNGNDGMDQGYDGHRTRDGLRRGVVVSGTRNKRTVWTVPSQAYPESHFATFPEDLIKPCILAGTSARGCCPKCGAPWERMTEDTQEYAAFKEAERVRKKGGMRSSNLETSGLTRGSGNKSVTADTKTIGWQPTCECIHDSIASYAKEAQEPIPCTVLDPFGGSGTTGQVALELGRNAILIELSPDYVKLAEQRTHVTPSLGLA